MASTVGSCRFSPAPASRCRRPNGLVRTTVRKAAHAATLDHSHLINARRKWSCLDEESQLRYQTVRVFQCGETMAAEVAVD